MLDQYSKKFQTTQWSLIREIESDSDAAKAALETLCRHYWKPVYHFTWNRVNDPERAKDITQSFFLKILEDKSFLKANPEAGRFRTFLLASIKNYIIDVERSNKALRRGGQYDFIQIDESEELSSSDDLDRHFDRVWAKQILKQVFEKMENEFTQSNKRDRYSALRPYLLNSPPAGEYGNLAERLSMTESGVRSVLQRIRERFRTLFREEIHETLRDGRELKSEINYLISVL
ncbi:MAG: RNA polymerase sigma factor [Opitutales bacterium]